MWYGGTGAGLADVFVAQGDSKQADDHVRQRRNDGEDQALLEGVGFGHGIEFTVA